MDTGDKVEFIDEKGKVRQGVIHGIKKVDSDQDGTPEIVGYLIDTGRAARVDKFEVNQRDEAIAEIVNKHIEKGGNPTEGLEKALKAKDLPPARTVVREVRHPQQVEIAPENVRPLK